MKTEESIILKSKEKCSLKLNEKNGLNTLVFPKGNITELSDGAFLNVSAVGNGLLQEVDIPNTVVKIGDKCFKECSKLEEVIIPNTTTTIGNSVFRDCRKLQHVKLPNSITELSDYLFMGCISLNRIYIPKDVRKIGNLCFDNCTSLSEIDIPDTIRDIGECAFANCSSLKKFSLGKQLVKINNELFYNCKNLESIEIPEAVTQIGKRAFAGCTKLQNIVLPNNLQVIDEYAFEECDSLKRVIIPASVTEIGSEAFVNCVNLEAVNILSNTPKEKHNIHIQPGAFSECNNLKTLCLPRGTLHNSKAFDFNNMPKLKTLIYAGKVVINLSDYETFNNLICNDRLIYVQYTNRENKKICTVMENKNLKKSDLRTSQLTRLFEELYSYDLIQQYSNFDEEKIKLCLNMLSTLNYRTCVNLVCLLQEKKKQLLSNKEISEENNDAKDIINTIEMKKSSFLSKIANSFKSLFKKKKNKIEEIEDINEVSTHMILDTLFLKPKTTGNINEYSRFFYANMKEIVNTADISQLNDLANIQRNFHKYLKDPIIKNRIQKSKFSLKDAIQCKHLYITDTDDFELDDDENDIDETFNKYYKEAVVITDDENNNGKDNEKDNEDR